MNFKFLRQAVAVVLVVATFVLSSVFVASPAMAADTTVIMGSKGLKFEPSKVSATAGDTITFEIGMAPPHNVVFTDKTDGATALNAALGDAKKGSDLIRSGEVTLTVPDGVAPGDYAFACTPHRGAGMIGKLTVE
ncbi:MAG: plastocyanin/azurin family copper-binding protein [Leptolyngbyaceae bacterium]|nr:plastocyanin/azurin family copper-binding protein [Leptolyngbyaceae bacterium]